MKKAACVFLVCWWLTGCGLFEVPLFLEVVGWSKTMIDGALLFEDRPPTHDLLLSEITKKDCRFLNMVEGKKICQDKLVDEMMEMNCKIYVWENSEEYHCEEESRLNNVEKRR
jgi:hypothetical protein